MKPKSARATFTARRFLVSDAAIRDRAAAALANMPVDPLRPLEVVLREQVKQRKLDQQALMFAGPIRDIAEQAWLDGRQYSAEIWHSYFKVQFLPEEYDPELCLEGYMKWDYDPAGERVLVGSTKQLTVKGMSEHIEQIHVFGAELGVVFRANPAEGRC